jgi:hypothetical protein
MAASSRSTRSIAPRAPLLAALAVFAAGVGWLVLGHHFGALESLGVPTMQPRFADARAISGASVALSQGLDPLVANPGDPLGRPMNYPRAWLALAWLGLAPEHTPWLALAFLAVFFAGLCALVPLATTRASAWCLALGALSPAVWIGVERANNDLPMFGLVALAALAVARLPWLAGSLIAAAATLKLFPIFAVAGLAGAGPRRATRLGLGLALAFVVYVIATRADLATIRANTAHWDRIGYGVTQLPHLLASAHGWPESTLLAVGTALLTAVVAASLWLRTQARLGGSPAQLAAFRCGAAIHVGTFCTGSHFDYRLSFLLLAVPQIATWLAAVRGATRAVFAVLLAAILAAMWSMTWMHWLRAGAGAESAAMLGDEAIGWILVTLLILAGALTLPDAVLPRRWRNARWLAAPPEPAAVHDLPAAAPGDVRRRQRHGATA